MKNLVFCFDVGGSSSATALFDLLDHSDDQVAWYHCEPARRRRSESLDAARSAIHDAYDFFVETWDPGDRVFVFGAGRGGYSAQAFARLLGTVGTLASTGSDLLDFVVDSYALPRTPRTSEDWDRVAKLIVDLNGGVEVAVPVAFLGLWDAIRPTGLPAQPDSASANVVAGRHALAIEGGPLHRDVATTPQDDVDRVWFRGVHCDVAGGPGACKPLVGIAADWMLEGAIAAGIRPAHGSLHAPSAPAQADALVGSARSVSRRKVPVDANVHASVEVYLRAHPEYWRRLPARVVWADQDWLARGERLVAEIPTVSPAEHQELAAAAS